MFLAIHNFRTNFRNFLSLFFLYLHKKWRDGPSYGGKWLLNRILHTAGICQLPNTRMNAFKESSIIMFLVLSAVKELLQ